jgi:hypothetical protein
MTIPEIKFSKIAVKMTFLTVLIYTLHITFEDGKKAFYGVSVNGWVGQGNIVTLAMLNTAMLRKM